MKTLRFVATAVVITIISSIIFSIGAVVDMAHYTNPDNFSLWSKIMMSTAGSPPLEFTTLSLVFAFIGALIFVFFYMKVAALLGKNALRKGLTYGFSFFVISTLLSSFSLFLLINIPAVLIISWAVQALVYCLVAGVVVAKLMK